MTVTVEGIYSKGVIQLLETPTGVKEGRVRVTLQDEEKRPEPRYITFGKYKGETETTEEDFKLAEWQGEEESLTSTNRYP